MITIPRKKNDNLRSLALYGSLSLNLGLMVMGGYFFGLLLERTYHWSNMSLTGVLTGLILGFYQMFVIASKVGKKKKDE